MEYSMIQKTSIEDGWESLRKLLISKRTQLITVTIHHRIWDVKKHVLL